MSRVFVLFLALFCASIVKAESTEYSIESIESTYLGIEDGKHMTAYSVHITVFSDDANAGRVPNNIVLDYVVFSKTYYKHQEAKLGLITKTKS